MTRILALLDPSIYGESVCDHAAWAAGRTGAAVLLLHVLDGRVTAAARADLTGNLAAGATETLLEELATLDAERGKIAMKRGRLILEAAKARLAAGVGEVATLLRNGDLLGTFAEFESTADLVVVGKRGEAADFATLHLGSNLERIIRTSRHPLLVASRAFRPIERVTVAFDGGASVLKAIDHMTRSPLFAGLPCRLLSVGSETPNLRGGIDRATMQLRAAGFEVAADIVPGRAEEVIARSLEGERAGLLVMGAYGHSRIRNMIIGSTTMEMIRSCRAPIMIFR